MENFILSYIRRRQTMIPRDELAIFYSSVSLYSFASSIVQIFIPIFLWENGFALPDILWFFTLSQTGRLAFLPLSAYWSSLWGAKKIIGLAFVLNIVYFIFLPGVKDSPAGFLAAALLFGASQAFLWVPYLVHLSKISPNGDRGKISGRLNAYVALSSSLGPLLGGVIIAHYGFGYAFLAAILFIIPAVYLLIITPEVSKIRKINLRLVSWRKITRDFTANGFYNFQNQLNAAVWAIFIFLIVPHYGSIGLIETVSLIISMVAFYFVGLWTDRFNRSKLLLLGSVLNSLIDVARIAANSALGVFLFNAASIFTGNLQAIPWSVKLQEHMDADARTEYMAIFEIGGTAITVLGLALFAVISLALPVKETLIYGIIVSSLAGLLINIVRG